MRFDARLAPLFVASIASASCGSSPPPSGSGGAAATSTISASTSTTSATCDPPRDTSHDGPFAPADQTPLFEKGLVLPPSSLPCVPVSTGAPQNDCNHHGSTIAELPDGRVAIVWYHGEAEKSLDSRLVWSSLTPGAQAFTEPVVLFDEPNLSDGNPALFVTDTGEILVFFPTIYGGGWSEARVRVVRSKDGGKTFSPAVTLRDAYCGNARHRPLALPSGDLVLPLYHECFALPLFLFSSDGFETWQSGDPLPFLEHASQIQPALIAGDGGKVLSITRDGSSKKRIHRMESDDLGHTWTPSAPLLLPNAGTSVDWTRLANGHVVVVFNNSPDDRFPLTVALSADEGKTFFALRDLNAECDQASCSWAYPSIMQSKKDGSLWVSYTYDRKTIGWAHFNEAWLAEGGQKPVLRCLLGEVCRDGACLASCESPADCDAEKGESCIEGACAAPCAGAAECCGGRCVAGRCLAAAEVVCDG